MLILVTGATGKVGRYFAGHLLADARWSHASAQALCRNRLIETTDRIEAARGSIADREVAHPR